MPALPPEQHPHTQIETIYEDHHSWLQGWLRQRLGNTSDAADLAQDTFLRLLASRRRELVDDPRALLRYIARGLVIDLWRRREVERAYLQSIAHLPEAQIPSEEARHLIIDSLLRIEAMLAGMPELTRQVFAMAQFDGLGHQLIADHLGISLSTVRRHLRKALIACIMAG
ncbi:sigma-70 family RNA polymerase sigma factor [Stutzerimonas kirkiae]|uniref:sigma-70 family RNA polymerase sigma factor n=1 Tax=Stutzerimonas kirkiae TaxID=2211392 RepID=UPI001038509B|nr:sigma-70 family RNA polymerase sigma factor [Stutzerimonas kirkiae]TBV12416.1 RNA polymerase subunit sigma [Stutzerimonas kirkiae]